MPGWVWLDRDNSREWVPPNWFFYNFATITHISKSENTKNLFSIFIIQTQFFEFWVMETNVKNQAKHKKFCGTHVFWKLNDKNWVISLKILVIQTSQSSDIRNLLIQIWWKYRIHNSWRYYLFKGTKPYICVLNNNLD